MQAPSITRFTALFVLSAASCAATALTLGSVQGAAYLGRPLDIQVAVQFSVQDDTQASCIGAEVLYNETRVDANKVSAQILTVGSGGNAGNVVRIKTTVVVDEPVVSILVRAGCQEVVTRQYLLLAEEFVAPPPKPTSSPSAVKAAKWPPAAGTKTRPRTTERLTLTTIDLTVDYEPVLRATAEMLVVPPEDAQRRDEAALRWKALSASPEALMQQEQQLQRLQEQRRELDAMNAANSQGLVELASKTQQAEDERYANGLVYSLLGMLLLVLLAIGWTWSRLRRAPDPNWAGSLYGPDSVAQGHHPVAQPPPQASQPAPAPKQNAPMAQPAVQHASPVKGAAEVAIDLDLDLGLHQIDSAAAQSLVVLSPPKARAATPAVSTKVKPVSGSAGAHRPSGFTNSGYGVERAIESEEVLNAREQAAFFMALGQSNRAIEVLRNRIEQIGESSPLVGLDLLNIYHAEGQRDDFEFMRQELMRWFAVRIPAFKGFRSEGQSLESYPDVVQKIESLWPKPQVLEYIESCVYQRDGEDGGVVFDLQAYQDLLLLYGTAKRMVRHAIDEHDATSASELLRFRPRTPEAGMQQVPDDTASPRMRTPDQEPTLTPPDEAAKHKGLTDFGFLHLH